jgi:plastocyanin
MAPIRYALMGLALATSGLAPACAETIPFSIAGMAFSKQAAPLHVGDVVVWSNHDFVAHTVTARDGSFDLSIPPGKTGQITLRHPGSTPFYCRFHPNMVGVFDILP